MSDFNYQKSHFSALLYVETVVVDRAGVPEMIRMNQEDLDAIEEMEGDGLIIWGGTGVNPVFGLTDMGWDIAHRLRRYRAERMSVPEKKRISFSESVEEMRVLVRGIASRYDGGLVEA